MLFEPGARARVGRLPQTDRIGPVPNVTATILVQLVATAIIPGGTDVMIRSQLQDSTA